MDLQHLRASDGTGEAVLAHIQSVRNPGSTVLDLDNVDNWNSKCVVVTGTPAANGFISPVGMKVMYGHLNAGDFIIDGYAPGYVDNGNTTAEVAIVKMTTNWADTLIQLLGNALADTGYLKTVSLDHFYKPAEITPTPFVFSGGVIAQTVTVTGSLSNIVYYIGGLRYTKTAIPNKTYTVSKDTYVDINAAGTITYSEVANNAAAPALAANSIRLGLVVTDATTITGIRQSGYDIGGNRLLPSSPIDPKQPKIFWEELGRDTVVSGTKTQLTVPIPLRKYLRVICVQHSGGVTLTTGLRFNQDAGTNYAFRTTENGGADSSASNQTWGQTGSNALEGSHAEFQIVNEATYRKIMHGIETFWDTSGGLFRNTFAIYWQNTSTTINRIDWIASVGAFRPGTELIILGHD